jgi:hypothetical protein
LSTRIRLGLTSDLLYSGFHTNIPYAFFFSSPICATCPGHAQLPAKWPLVRVRQIIMEP